MRSKTSIKSRLIALEVANKVDHKSYEIEIPKTISKSKGTS